MTTSFRGKPVSEIRSIGKKVLSSDERLKELEKRGAYIPAKAPLTPFKSSLQRRPGALKRFLEDRNK